MLHVVALHNAHKSVNLISTFSILHALYTPHFYVYNDDSILLVIHLV